MSKAKNSNPSEEVDLGQLFKMIGNAFTRLYKFIGSIFHNLLLAVIWLVLFVKKRIIIFSAAGFVYIILRFDFRITMIFCYDFTPAGIGSRKVSPSRFRTACRWSGFPD